MKTGLIFILVIVAFFATACTKTNQQATVVKDCTGVYLRMNNKDFQVCNTEKLENYKDGSSVKVSFTKINICNGTAKDAIVCMMLHENEGWIEVKSIK